MAFRWFALLTLWTLLSGPIFGTPAHSDADERSVVACEETERVALESDAR